MRFQCQSYNNIRYNIHCIVLYRRRRWQTGMASWSIQAYRQDEYPGRPTTHTVKRDFIDRRNLTGEIVVQEKFAQPICRRYSRLFKTNRSITREVDRLRVSTVNARTFEWSVLSGKRRRTHVGYSTVNGLPIFPFKGVSFPHTLPSAIPPPTQTIDWFQQWTITTMIIITRRIVRYTYLSLLFCFPSGVFRVNTSKTTLLFCENPK